jgi:hypothetical protein
MEIGQVVKQFESHGLLCVIRRHSRGHLNGYVAVPPAHRYFGKQYDDVACEVHGGITFAESSANGHPLETEETLWWLGFDTAHCCDDPAFGGTVKTQEYVELECIKLAAQLQGKKEER